VSERTSLPFSVEGAKQSDAASAISFLRKTLVAIGRARSLIPFFLGTSEC